MTLLDSRARTLAPFLAALLGAPTACSSGSTGAATAPPPGGGEDASAVADAAVTDEPAAVDSGIDPHIPDAGPVSCSAPTASTVCQNGDSWVFGIARFNPKLVPAGVKPVLRLALRHDWLIYPTENVIGGRLHAYVNVPVTDAASGQVPFQLDMCEFGTAMWSEENGLFNLVGILDFNGNNDLDNAQSQAQSETIAKPDVGEPTTLVSGLDVTCHAAGSCVDLRLECIDGVKCTTITPIASCTKKTPSCPSDSTFCM